MQVVVVEQREVIRQGLVGMITGLGFVETVVGFAGVEDAVADATAVPPDVIVVGQHDALHRLGHLIGPRTKRLLVLSSAEPSHVMSAVQLDANGYLLVDHLTASGLGEMLRDVVAGAISLPPEIARYLLAHARGDTGFLPHQHLTSRESEVLTLLTEGLSNHQIAQRLRISVHGAKRHVSNVLAKLNSPNRAQAVAKALQSGLVTNVEVIDLSRAGAGVAL